MTSQEEPNLKRYQRGQGSSSDDKNRGLKKASVISDRGLMFVR